MPAPTKPEFTPTPWIAVREHPDPETRASILQVFPIGERDNSIEIFMGYCAPEGSKQARDIRHAVACVNSHPELIDALNKSEEALATCARLPIARGYPDGPCLDREDSKEVAEALASVRAALKLATPTP